MQIPALSVQHSRENAERSVGPTIKLVAALSDAAPEKLASFRAEYDQILSEYYADNFISQDFLLTRARKM